MCVCVCVCVSVCVYMYSACTCATLPCVKESSRHRDDRVREDIELLRKLDDVTVSTMMKLCGCLAKMRTRCENYDEDREDPSRK